MIKPALCWDGQSTRRILGFRKKDRKRLFTVYEGAVEMWSAIRPPQARRTREGRQGRGLTSIWKNRRRRRQRRRAVIIGVLPGFGARAAPVAPLPPGWNRVN